MGFAAQHDLRPDAELTTRPAAVADVTVDLSAELVDVSGADLLELRDVDRRRDRPAAVALVPVGAGRPAAPAGPLLVAPAGRP